MRPRPHLENISARDIGQFVREQETTMKVYADTPKRSDAVIAQIGHIPGGCRGYFITPLRLSSSQCNKHCFLLAPRGIDKIPGNASWGYF